MYSRIFRLGISTYQNKLMSTWFPTVGCSADMLTQGRVSVCLIGLANKLDCYLQQTTCDRLEVMRSDLMKGPVLGNYIPPPAQREIITCKHSNILSYSPHVSSHLHPPLLLLLLLLLSVFSMFMIIDCGSSL